MRRVRWVLLGLLVALTVAGAVRSARVNGVETRIVREPAIGATAAAASSGPTAPEFPHADPDAWINSPPLRMSALRGKVVLLDVWTFG
jgi:hypothetical protein